MSADFLNIIRREVERVMAGRHSKRYGLVTSYDPVNHLAKVTLQPEGQETGWLTIKTKHIGNGWGIVVGLTPGDGKTTGDQVELQPQEGDTETLAIVGVVHSEQDKPPAAQSGEIILQHQSGSKISFSADKKLTMIGSGGSSTVHDASGNITHTDSSGGVIHQAGGKVYLGSASASSPVMLASGPSTTTFGT
jgi:phage baseplate assembly protein gpV